MEEEEKERRSDLFNNSCDQRNALSLNTSILKNNEVVVKFRGLPNKKT